MLDSWNVGLADRAHGPDPAPKGAAAAGACVPREQCPWTGRTMQEKWGGTGPR
jgi:hypothetical protein